jgi:hypothetical protein
MATRFDDHEAPFFELDEARAETSLEAFDRLAFAREVVAQLLPDARAAICNGTRQVQVMSGRMWGNAGGKTNRRWVVVAVPPSASRRAIVQAIGTLGVVAAPPYFFDIHFTDPYR